MTNLSRHIRRFFIQSGMLVALPLVVACVTSAALADTHLADKTQLPSELVEVLLANHATNSRSVFFSTYNTKLPAELVPIDAVARSDGSQLLNALQALGLRSAERHGRIVSGYLPSDLLGELDDIDALFTVKQAGVRFASGSTTTEGDRGMRSDTARTRFDVDGTGVRIGVISDSYDCLGGAVADISSGDLPADVELLREADDCEGKLDEGRALMQIIHDIAPGSTLVFRSGATGTAGVANAILELGDAGADVIIDDASVPTTSWFQHGPIARAVQQIEATGVVHVTAAGNEARNSYDSAYRGASPSALNLRAHDFDPGPAEDTLQGFELPEGSVIELVLQWDNPAISNSGSSGAVSDLDIYVTNESATQFLGVAAVDNIGKDPVEYLTFFNPEGSGQTHFNLLIVNGDGPAPGRVKYIIIGRFAGAITEHGTASSTIFGHANTVASIAVGAVDHALASTSNTEAPPLRFFSSAGGTPILFDSSGARYIEPIEIRKPDVAAPDGVATTFFRNDPDGPLEFIGTSASAPHVAGVAALLIDARNDLTPADVRALLAASARDIVVRDGDGDSATGPGFDFDSGYGLVDAESALALVENYQLLSAEPIAQNLPVAPSEIVSVGGGAGAFSWIGLVILTIFFRRISVRWHKY